MANAAEGRPADTPIQAPVQAAAPPQISGELERKLKEKDEEIRRLREEFEQLKAGRFEEEPEEEFGDSYEEPPEEDLSGEAEGYGEEEEDGALFKLFSFDEDEEEETESSEDGEEEPIWDDSEDEEEAESGEAPDGFEDELEEGGEDEDETEEDDDFMSSFCRFAESLQSMTVFERMKANGTQTANITLEELIKEAETQTARRREKRNASQE